ncbi:replication protein RepA [Candidatus Nephthysia bennettiae]|uniref:replication protein RepA n=1 Tax=Candidatus Nephthysia bennettiae TaxID=3127016 RepID=UPI0030C65E0B
MEEAREAGEIGFYARLLVQLTLPHSAVLGNEYERRNGDLVLSLLAPSRIGLPYGSLPRLLLAWVTAEAVRTKQRELVFGNTLASFMEQLDLIPTGGRWGSIPRLRQQMTRLFATTISVSNTGNANLTDLQTATVADRALIFWDPQRPSQAALWHSTVTLSERFFESITHRPVPIDMRALKALRRSPMALDFYVFLTHRMSYLRKPVPLPWELLKGQFGAEYGRLVDFRAQVRKAIRSVQAVYPQLDVRPATDALWLYPSPTHVPRINAHTRYA